MSVESEVDVGSTFTVTLRNVKMAKSAPAASDSQTEGACRVAHAPSRVLIVDDSKVNRSVLKALLAKCGVRDMVMAENGREAMEILERDAKIDLVFSDLWMPELDGYGLIRAIRSNAKFLRLPVYLITADVEACKQANAADFTGVLYKPVTLEKLRSLFG